MIVCVFAVTAIIDIWGREMNQSSRGRGAGLGERQAGLSQGGGLVNRCHS